VGSDEKNLIKAVEDLKSEVHELREVVNLLINLFIEVEEEEIRPIERTSFDLFSLYN